MTARTIARPGGDIGYAVSGDGPPLLLLHATLSDSRQLRGLADRLSRGHTVLSVDRRGHGASTEAGPEPPAPIDVSVHLDDLLAILDGSDIASADIVGHSYGGCVALELAARYPSRVRRLVLWEPPYLSLLPPAQRGPKGDVGQRTLEAAEQGGPGAAALAFMEGVSGRAVVAALSPKARRRVELAGPGAIADATLAGMDPNGLGRVRSRSLVGVGADSEPTYGVVAAALVARIDTAASQRVPDADHLAPITRPDTVAAVVEDFLVR